MTGESRGIRRVIVAGGTGYIGRKLVRELLSRGYQVVCLARQSAETTHPGVPDKDVSDLAGATLRETDITDPESLERTGFQGEKFDAVVSCIASRSGAVKDSWLVDYQANCHLLQAAKHAGVKKFVLLSAICVQKPDLEFQKAKLAFEETLLQSEIASVVVRPTAFFKSLAGQVERVKRGKPFLLFGDGELTSCKPISETDLAAYLVDCLEDSSLNNCVLPIGGPGPAITPRQQGELLFRLCGREPHFRRVPVAMMDSIVAVLSVLSKLIPTLKDKAEFARIGRYYATESMLVLDKDSGGYSAGATPSYGEDTLESFYRRVLKEGLQGQELGDHAVFEKSP